MQGNPRKSDEIPRGPKGYPLQNTWRPIQILSGTHYKSFEILRGTPYKTTEKSVKSIEILGVPFTKQLEIPWNPKA